VSEVKPAKPKGGPGAREWRLYLMLWPTKVNTETRGGYRDRCTKWGFVRRAQRRQLVDGELSYVYRSNRL
jgi:hypothetical protein